MDKLKKICTKCNIEKELECFNKQKLGKFGVGSNCKSCISEYSKIQAIINKDKNHQYYINNKTKINSKSKMYYEDNKEEHNERCKINQKNNPKIGQKATKKWIENNPGYHKEYRKNRYKEDPGFRLRLILSTRFSDLLRKKRINRNNSVVELLGCLPKELEIYIESQFLPEWDWDNHGVIWEIDHIKPCSSFDLTDSEQQKLCFHYSNLQPLFKTTKIAESFGYIDQIGNRNKSDKMN